MKIIDWETKGNVVRFYLGEDDLKEWYGDDWDDRPYEHNAGKVYSKFVKDIKDIKLDFDDILIEPCEGQLNSPYSKDDFRDRKIPCLIVIKEKDCPEDSWKFNYFQDWINYKKSIKIYFGDDIQKIIKLFEKDE